MSGINLTINNIDQVNRAFKEAPQAMVVGIQSAIEKLGVKAVKETKIAITEGRNMWKSPIDTGMMRQGIYARFEPMKAIITPSSITPYAMYVHEGTGKMRARPFFEITAQSKSEEFADFFNKCIETELSKVFKIYG